MTKRFCDLCGKEINSLQDTYRVSVENNADIPYASDPNIVDVNEICPACANRIRQTVKELKLEGLV
nr:MAG TPA: Acetophenone carboxylase delta subunit [Caudoviricetes sp.]